MTRSPTASSLALSLAFGVARLALVGDDAALGERVDQLVAAAIERAFASWRALGTALRGWVNVKNGDVAEGISLLRSGSNAFRAMGSEASVPYERHVDPELLLQFDTDPLLLLQIGRIEPLGAQFLDAWTVGPAVYRLLAIGANGEIAERMRRWRNRKAIRAPKSNLSRPSWPRQYTVGSTGSSHSLLHQFMPTRLAAPLRL